MNFDANIEQSPWQSARRRIDRRDQQALHRSCSALAIGLGPTRPFYYPAQRLRFSLNSPIDRKSLIKQLTRPLI